jgi:hypothetical protein
MEQYVSMWQLLLSYLVPYVKMKRDEMQQVDYLEIFTRALAIMNHLTLVSKLWSAPDGKKD